MRASGWLATIATYNPVTYVLEGLRSLITEGWVWEDLGKGLLAILAVMVGRVYVGAHNPLDVVCGLGVGMVAGGLLGVIA